MFSVASFHRGPGLPSSSSCLGVPAVFSVMQAGSALECSSWLRGPSWWDGRMSDTLSSQTPKSSGFCQTALGVFFKRLDDLIPLRQILAPRYCFGQRACCDPYRRYLQTDVLTQHSFFFKLKGEKCTEEKLISCWSVTHFAFERFGYQPSVPSSLSYQGDKTAPCTTVARTFWRKMTSLTLYNCYH